MRDIALANGFESEKDPLFKAAFLQTQLDAGNPAGTYAVSVPYAPTAAGAQQQINNTLAAAGTKPGTNRSSGGKGFGSAHVVDSVKSAVTLSRPKQNNPGSGLGSGGIGGGIGGGRGGAR